MARYYFLAVKMLIKFETSIFIFCYYVIAFMKFMIFRINIFQRMIFPGGFDSVDFSISVRNTCE